MTLEELNEVKKLSYSYQAHNAKGKWKSFCFCSGCGLMYFRNELTKKAMDLGCNYDLHPSFKRKH